MALSRFRKNRKVVQDPRYYPYFPEAYRAFIKSIPYSNRVHVRASSIETQINRLLLEDGSNFFQIEEAAPLKTITLIDRSGNDLTADGSFEKPFATIKAAVNYIVDRQIKPPYGTYAFVIYPGDYTENGFVNPLRATWPDFRVSLFTDFFQNPIRKLSANKRYLPDAKGRLTVDKYNGHAFLNQSNWTYLFHYIGAGGNTRIRYQTFPDYYDPSTGRYRGNFAVEGKNKLSYLGLWPTRFKAATYDSALRRTIPASGGNNMYESGFTFNAPSDGLYTVKYYVEDRRVDNNFYRLSNAISGSPLHENLAYRGLYWDERYNYFFIDSTNANPTGNVELIEKGNITIHGIANIDSYVWWSHGSSLKLLDGGAYVPYEADTNLDFRTRDFTIEGYFYFGKTGNFGSLFSNHQIANRRTGYNLTFDGSRLNSEIHDENGRLNRLIRLRSNKITTDTWHHIALVRSNVTARLFVDGFLVDSRATTRYNSATRRLESYRYDITAGAGSHYIGGGQVTSDTRIYGRGANVWVDSFRITDVARYEPASVATPISSFAAPPAGDTSNLMILNLENDIADTGINPRAMQKRGTILTTLNSPFNAATNTANSVVFTPSNFLRVPHNSNLNLPNKFMIEFWLLIPSTYRNPFTVFSKYASSPTTNRSFYLQARTSGWTYAINFTGAPGWSVVRFIDSGQVYDDWNHFLFSKDGDVYKFFQNGELISYRTESSSSINASTADIAIGADFGSTTSGTSLAMLNNFRYMVDTSMTANSFGVPTQDLSPPDPTDTTVKLQFAQTGNALTDASTYNNTIQNRFSVNSGSNIFATAVTPFGEGGLASYFWTTPFVSFVKVPYDLELDPLLTDTFTVEFFYKFTNIALNSRVEILSNAPTPQVNFGEFTIILNSNSAELKIARYSIDKKLFPDIDQIFNGVYNITPIGAITNPSAWNHFVWTSQAGNWKFYINGLTNGRTFKTGINTAAVRARPRPNDPDVALELNMTNGLYIARPRSVNNGDQWRGGLHGLRISDHVKYNGPFTVPDIPLDQGGGVSLLSFDSPGLFSRPTGNHFSISFVGPGASWLLLGRELTPFNATYGTYRGFLEVGSSNFTIELYAKFPVFPDANAEPGGTGFNVYSNNNANTAKFLIGPYGSSRWSGFCIGPTKIYYVQHAATNGASGWSSGVNHNMNANEWYHIAIERSGNTVTYYIDGDSVGSESITGSLNYDPNDSSLVIAGRASSNSLECSIFNVRISNDAIYGSNFIPPSDTYKLEAGDSTTTFIGLTKASDTYTAGIGFIPPATTTYIAKPKKYGLTFFNVDSPLAPFAESKRIKYNQYGTILESKNVPFNTTLGGSQLFLGSSLKNADSVPITLVGTDARQLGTVDYTIEGFVYKHTTWRNREPILNFANVGFMDGGGVVLRSLDDGSSKGYILRWPDGGKPDAKSISYKEVNIDLGHLPPSNTWFHLAIVKSGTFLSIFEAGNLVYTTIDARHNMPSTQLILGGTRFDSITTPISFSNWRVSVGARYLPNVNYPNVFSSLGDPFFSSNVGAMAHFSNYNYRWKGTPPNATDNFNSGSNHGFEQKIYLAQGTHTINVSAIAHTFQGKWGGEIADSTGQIIWSSRYDPRDNNLGYLRHPESTVRGIHVTYPGAKPFYYQNALFGPPETNFSPPEVFVDKTVLNNGDYDPYSGGFDLKIGQTRNAVVRDPVTKTSTTVQVRGKLALQTTRPAARGTFYNVAVEGTELMLKFSGGGAFVTMENCTFMFPKVSTDPSFTPALSIGHFHRSSGTSAAANMTIKSSVFGDIQGRFTKNTIQSMVTGEGQYWKQRPRFPIFGANALLDTAISRNAFPIMDQTVFGATLAPNTFVITNNVLAPETLRTGLNFRYGINDSQRVINEGTNPTDMTLYRGVTTVQDFYTPRASTTGSMLLPDIGVNTFYNVNQQKSGITYPYAVTNSGLLPANANEWRITLMVYHLGNFRAQDEQETIFINGDYKQAGKDRFFPTGTLSPGSLQLVARSQQFFQRVTGSGANRVLTNFPGQARFKLYLYRVGHPYFGARSTYTLISAGWYYVNEWHGIEIKYSNDVLQMLVNGEVVGQTDFNRIQGNVVDPASNFSNHNTTRFILGRPPLYDVPGGFRARHWQGYINQVRSYVGSSISQNDVGVYGGTFRWYLPWQT